MKRAEQLHLYFVVEVPHLVEKQRAAVGRLEGTLLVLVGPRESSLDIAEKLRGCHFAWDGAAVKGKERFVGTRTQCMDATGDILLSSATGAEDEY